MTTIDALTARGDFVQVSRYAGPERALLRITSRAADPTLRNSHVANARKHDTCQREAIASGDVARFADGDYRPH